MCLNDLQICDNVSDCPEGSDESSDSCLIPSGNYINSSVEIIILVYILILSCITVCMQMLLFVRSLMH